ncbi:MAG: alanine racemase, partial [bacterium]
MSYCWAEIDLNAIIHNLKQIQSFVGEKVKIMAVVKADAYGHGLVEVGKAISQQGDFYLGVSSLEEGIRLREAGIKSPIVNLLPTLPENLKEAIHYNITPIISNEKIAPLIEEESGRQGKTCKVHIKIDTGMGRLGISPHSAVELIRKLKDFAHLDVEGIYTHFASADSDQEFTRQQLAIFLEIINKLEQAGIKIPLKHSANSAAIFSLKESHLDMVRPGIALYGINPAQNGVVKLQSAMSVKAKIIEVKELPAGHSISYGRTYILPRRSRVAVVGIGYAQGFLRALSNRGNVLVKGKRAPVLGVVCMDQLVVDVS